MSERTWSGLMRAEKRVCFTDMLAFTSMQDVGVLGLQAACGAFYGSDLMVEHGNAGADGRLVPAFPELLPLTDPMTLHSVMGAVAFPAFFPKCEQEDEHPTLLEFPWHPRKWIQ